MKVFTAILCLGTFLVLSEMPEKIFAQHETTTSLPPPGPHEEYQECGTPCYNTCAEPHAEDGPCQPMCNRANFCVGGYIRERENGPCILPSECPHPAGSRYH